MKLFYRSLATAGGIGLLPLAPGTWAALATSLIWFSVNANGLINFQTEIFIILLICITGTMASEAVISDWGKDPSRVVIDEVAGMSIALMTIPVNIKYYTMAFVLFRFFDIVKPLGIKKAEKARGGFGIMMDDIVAGVYSLIVLKLIIFSGII